MNSLRTSPIVVLDSGLGGLTVVKALRSALPAENIVYFGDTARLPYGSKTSATVTGFVKQIIGYVEPLRPKHIVIACNTATALALPAVRMEFPGLSISGVIEPGAKAAIVAAGSKQFPILGILATEATVRSKAYERAIHRRRQQARLLLRPTPLLVPIIEEGRGPDDPLVQLAISQYLTPLLKHKMDVLVLGCTHYPIFKELIRQTVGPRVRVIDSAEACADDVARRLAANSRLNVGTSGEPAKKMHEGTLRCFVTDDPRRFASLAPRFLGSRIDMPTWVSLDELSEGHESDTPMSVPA
jgi:glutamate racemase